MSQMSNYCKAYYVKQLREYRNWKEETKSLRKSRQQVDGKEVEVERTSLNDNDIVYLHDSFVVTDDIYKDEHVVFDQVGDEWKQFCREVLAFKPDSVTT
ncbi:MAG TPA: hypothetical protein VFC07_05660 [Verrucomicrobiae bacterium]|nr:hypothetical protein [Verrucomicrobiae bacterium]